MRRRQSARGHHAQGQQDGAKFEVFAPVCNPNGARRLADGFVTEADNQGEWFPPRASTSSQRRIPRLSTMSHQENSPHQSRQTALLVPKDIDNSSGGQTWVIDDRFGPFKLHDPPPATAQPACSWFFRKK